MSKLLEKVDPIIQHRCCEQQTNNLPKKPCQYGLHQIVDAIVVSVVDHLLQDM